MTSWRGLCVLVFLAPVAAAVGADDPDAGSKRAIKQVLDEQAAAWNKGDLQGFMKAYLKSDKLTFFSGDKKTTGWQATLERYQKKYQGEGKEMGQLTFSEIAIDLLGPDA